MFPAYSLRLLLLQGNAKPTTFHVVVDLGDAMFECKACGIVGCIENIHAAKCDPVKQRKLRELASSLDLGGPW